MPKMGESVMEGTVLEWKKAVGDTVEQDETLLEISTDKVDSEVPSPEAGRIVEILVEENDTVDVGTPIAVIETDVTAEVGGGDASAPPAQDASAQAVEVAAEPLTPKGTAQPTRPGRSPRPRRPSPRPSRPPPSSAPLATPVGTAPRPAAARPATARGPRWSCPRWARA